MDDNNKLSSNEAARIHLNDSFEWSPLYKKAFSKYVQKGGCFCWGGHQNNLEPTVIHFSSASYFLKEISDPETCAIFHTCPKHKNEPQG